MGRSPQKRYQHPQEKGQHVVTLMLQSAEHGPQTSFLHSLIMPPAQAACSMDKALLPPAPHPPCIGAVTTA